VAKGFAAFDGAWEANARLAWDTLALKPTRGIPTTWLNVMDHGLLEQVAGYQAGEYKRQPVKVYRDFQANSGVSCCDQWIPENPLTMSDQGFEPGTDRGATTGADRIVVDGMVIDSPEAVVANMERHLFPALIQTATELDPDDDGAVARLIEQEVEVQTFFGPNLLKMPYEGFQDFPRLYYDRYGYENYFMAYALYPDLIARSFVLQADVAVKRNTIAARAIIEGGLPRVLRSDHDMTDSRGTLADPKTLEAMWFPQFARSIRPFLDAGVRVLWHCDGNVMPMVPGLIASGISGFQGFQYEDGVDYPALCRMTDRDGGPLMIWAGASVTRTLPMGTKDDVVAELKWLVEHGPPVGLFLGASSSITPATNRENVRTLIEGLAYYREHGRG